MSDKSRAITLRIPEGAYDLLVEAEEDDGLAPAVRVRKLVLDYLDWGHRRRITGRSEPKPPAQRTPKASPNVRRKNPEGTRSERRAKKPAKDDPADDIARQVTEVARWEKR